MKKDYVFNTIAGLIDASEAVIISMIITRTTGLTDAGYVTIAFAVGILLLTIGKFGVYSFQVTDHNCEYNFLTYLYLRIITIFTMLICLISYIIYGHLILHYPINKSYIILFIGLIYAIEAIEDLFKANCHYIGKLYIGALMFIIRWIIILITFGISIVLTTNTAKALGISCFISAVVFIMCCYLFRQYIGIIHVKTNSLSRFNNIHSSNSIFGLLSACFPLFLSSFLSFYIINSSKYAIEKYMNADAQACFGFVAMPIFAIGLLNSFIFQPQIIDMTAEYNEGQKDFLKKRIKKQYFIIVLITIICILTAYFIGIPFLSMLYHTDLNGYLPELLILLFGGGFLALSGYQGIILTIMRKQYFQLYGYIPVSVLAFCFVGTFVKKYGTLGGAFSYLILSIILSILYQIFIYRELN